MTALADHQSHDFTKLILMGDSGTGKTGSLASLVKAGYKLRILDYDNGLDILAQLVRRNSPDKLANVEFRTLRDKRRSSQAGPIIDGMPSAFVDGLKLIDNWPELDKPANWGPETVLVVDSLTFLGDAAYNWARGMNPAAKEPRSWFYHAQQSVEAAIALLTAESFRTNVIVTAHIRYMDLPDGRKKGYPTAVGSALGPTIPAYFNSVAQCETDASGKRTIRTVPSALIDLKNPASFDMAPSLPIDTGLADFFLKVRKKS